MILLLALTGCRHDACRPVDLGDPQASLQATLEACWTESGAPGVAVAVLGPDGAWSAAAGQADLERGTPMTPTSSVRAGSLTKTFTAALVLQQVDRGLLSLDDPLADWFPELPQAGAVTVRDLLAMTSGYGDYMDAEALDADRLRAWEPGELVALALAGGALAEPGERYAYANTNFVLLGLLLERATGLPYPALLRGELLGPQGLETSWLDAAEPPLAELVRGYTDQGGWVDIGDRTHPSVAWSAGALAADVEALARWGWALYRGEVLGQELTGLMTEPVSERGAAGQWYGLGATVYETPVGTAFGHKGRFSGHYSWFGYLPERGLAVATYANTSEDFADPRPAAWAAVELLGR